MFILYSPQDQCVQQGVTPCQHFNSLTILPYPQVKQQAAEKEVPVYQPNNTSRLQRLNKLQYCANKQYGNPTLLKSFC